MLKQLDAPSSIDHALWSSFANDVLGSANFFNGIVVSNGRVEISGAWLRRLGARGCDGRARVRSGEADPNSECMFQTECSWDFESDLTSKRMEQNSICFRIHDLLIRPPAVSVSL